VLLPRQQMPRDPAAPPDCTAQGHRCPAVKRPCPGGCISHAQECPQRIGGGWQIFRRKGVTAGKGKAKLVLALPAPLVTQLRAHRRDQAVERLAAGEAWQDWDLVFLYAPRSSDEWCHLVAQAGIFAGNSQFSITVGRAGERDRTADLPLNRRPVADGQHRRCKWRQPVLPA
jgi:hypothetical protein